MRDEMKLTMNAIAENEYFARVAVAAFSAKMDPTMEELADIKTAVSEAVTNAVVHGYDHKGGILEIDARIEDEWLEIEIEDEGIGIDDVKQAMNHCIHLVRRRIMPVWGLLLWKLLWMNWRLFRRPDREQK